MAASATAAPTRLPFLDPVVFTEDYLRVALGSAALFIVAHYAALLLLSFLPETSLELNEAALKRKQDRAGFLRMSASCAVAFVYHSLGGPAAAYALFRLATCADASMASYVLVDPTLPSDTEVAEIQRDLMWLSEVFVGYMVSQLWFWMCGWEEGLTALLHHVTFMAICLVSANYNFIVGAASLAMEMSSPALNLHLVYRNLAGERAEHIQDVSVKVFGLLFFFFRVLVYGTTVVLLLYILCTQDLPVLINWYKMGVSVALILAGLGLQLYWLNQICAKAMRKRKKLKAAAAVEPAKAASKGVKAN